MISVISLMTYIYIFWILYVYVMGVYRAHLDKRLYGIVKILSYPTIFFAFIIDIFANIVIASFLFIDKPHEWLVTTRLIRYKNGDYGWRTRVAHYICHNLLDPFDPSGKHCE